MNLVVVLCIAGFSSSLALRSIDPMLPVLAAELGVGFGDAALLITAYSVPYAVMLLVLGPAADAIGKGRLIRFCLAGFALSLGASVLAPGYWWLFAARAVAGAFAGGLIPVALALIGDQVPFAQRQVAISRFLVVTIIGQMSGAMITGLLSEVMGWRAIFGFMGVVAAGATIMAYLHLKTGDQPTRRLTVSGAWSDYRVVFENPIALLIFGMAGAEGILVLGILSFIAPLLAMHDASGVLEAGIAIAAFALGGISYGAMARFLIGMFRQRQLVRLGGLMAGVMYMAAALPLHWLSAVPLFFFAGFGFFMLHNTMQTQATELAPRARGSAMALFAAALFLGQGLGPVFGGLVTRAVGVSTLFVTAGILIAAISLSTARLVKER
jgi:MFS transporter, DHA1 family, inner membrane transport protein